MIFTAARAALRQIFTAPFRAVLVKSLGLTIALLVVLWFPLRAGFDAYALPFIDAALSSYGSWVEWVGFFTEIVLGLLLASALALMIAPVSAIIAGLFLDDVAEAVERSDYPYDPPGRAVPLAPALWLSLRFFGLVVVGNLFALLLLLVPGVNLVAFFVVNGYLLGREFFEFAAMRHRPEAEAKALRRRHAGRVFLAGLLIAGFLAVPLVNLLTPLFAAAMMVHLHRAISSGDGRSAAVLVR